MNKIVIKSKSGEILFEYEKENNTLKDTVEKAVKQGVSLAYANLYGANLRYANLRGADLVGADLSNANLRYADLSKANLYGANLYEADLYYANLIKADLIYSYLNHSNLSHINLKNAKLYEADLIGADLSYADLNGTNLWDADLRFANLSNTNIDYPIACPSEGSFIGWKKVYYDGGYWLVKLEIPEDAKRCSATTNKCRCDKAKVLEITNIVTDETINEIVNINYYETVYKVGEIVYPDSFDENRWNECSHGIHFFIDKQCAVNYIL